MKHLMIFNQDYADEHDVPAIAFFTPERLEEWKKLPIGEVNPKYKATLEERSKCLEAEKLINAKIRKELGDTWHSIKFTDWPPELLKEYNNISLELRKFRYIDPYSEIYIRANLGNNGDGFGEQFEGYTYAGELIEAGIVKVTDIPTEFVEQFEKIYNESGLSHLSLCNVFELDEDF